MTQGEMTEVLGDRDMEAFHLSYQDAAGSVYNFILSLTRNPEEAEDVMQDTYLTVWTKVGSYVPQGKPLVRVFIIAKNLCYTRFGEQKMKADVVPEDLAEEREGEYCAPLKQAADHKVLFSAPGQISREERQITLLHATTDMKHREVAEALQMLLATALSKYNRSMKELQELLGCSG